MASPPTSEAHPEAKPSPEVDIATLRSIVLGEDGSPGLVDVIPRLQRSHRKELIRVERWTTGDLARHPEPREIIRSRRRAGNVDEHGRLRQIFDARRVLVEDVHENRVVLHAVRDVRKRLAKMAQEDEEAADLLKLLDGAVASTPFLDNVTDVRTPPRTPTPTLIGDPLYRTVFDAWLRLPLDSD
jgi:hypothetical protein